MAEAEDFSHGSYGDYSGVVFYGPPTNGFWLDRLAVSNRYIDPLFRAVLDRSWAQSGGEQVPRLVSDWSTLEGWAAAGGIIEVSCREIEELLKALAAVTAADLAPHCAGSTPAECIRCAESLQRFLGTRLACGVTLFMDDE